MQNMIELSMALASGGISLSDPAAVKLCTQVAAWLLNDSSLLQDQQWISWLINNWPMLLEDNSCNLKQHLNEWLKQELEAMDTVFKNYTQENFQNYFIEKYGTESMIDGVFNEKTQHKIMTDYKLYHYEAYQKLISKMPLYVEFIKNIDLNDPAIKLSEKYMPGGYGVELALWKEKCRHGFI